MPALFIQLLVGGLIIVLAGLKSLRFIPNELTDFELDRRVQKEDKDAVVEKRLRQEWPLHHALIRLAILLLTIIVIIILSSTFNVIETIVYAFLWLLLAELLSANKWITAQTEQLVVAHRPQLFKVVDALRPFLQFMQEKRLLNQKQQTMVYSKEELLDVMRHGATFSAGQKLFIKQALTYEDILVKDVMTPRSVVVTVDKNDTVGPLFLDQLHKTGHSRFPVIEKDLDHVVGMLYMHDLLPLSQKIKKVSDAMKSDVFYVNQDKSLDHVLHAFLRTRRHLFIVVNEFEETTGVISIEDILEQIIGRKIVDEFDQYEDLRAVAKLAATKRQKSNPGKHV